MNTDFAVEDLSLEGVKLITPFYMEDNRGFFMKDVEKDIYRGWGLNADICETFESGSRRGVIRGLHFQLQDPQIKIVRVISGVVHDVVVDLRDRSDTFGKYIDVVLSGQNHKSLWIPAGYAHGFEALTDDVIMSYKCIGKYRKGYDSGIVWNDPELNIKWSTDNPVISKRDAGLMSFSSFRKRYRCVGG